MRDAQVNQFPCESGALCILFFVFFLNKAFHRKGACFPFRSLMGRGDDI